MVLAICIRKTVPFFRVYKHISCYYYTAKFNFVKTILVSCALIYILFLYTTKKQTTKFLSAYFKKILSPSYIIFRIQRLEGKQCRSRWRGSLWATSSRSMLFVNQLFSSLVLKEIGCVLNYHSFVFFCYLMNGMRSCVSCKMLIFKWKLLCLCCISTPHQNIICSVWSSY